MSENIIIENINNAEWNAIFFATASPAQIEDFCERNGIMDDITLTSAGVWVKGAELAHIMGAIPCHRKNTKKNRIRGNFYFPRLHHS